MANEARLDEYEELSKEDFERLLLIKNQLILLNKDKLRELFSDVKCYLAFIDNVICLFNNEAAFLYLSKDFLNKIRDVLELHRFDLTNEVLAEFGPTVDEVREAVNNVTVFLNKIDTEDKGQRRLVSRSYLAYNEDIRCVKFDKIEDFGTALSYDAPVYFTLTGEFEKPIRDDMMLSSINSFMETAPVIFEDPGIVSKAIEIIDGIHKRSSIFDISGRSLTKRAKEKLKTYYQGE